ncbi:hypothetical protein [Roseovarius mucosus]|uniref:hypothetical protein n=1 Tax=Roseovarius mucosus TaxID=215743 RepID=UPI0035CF19D1|tara:strand:- start:505 stop:1224 length:720 start_codon:yes stop_codon:yes gene_type:complete
MRFEVACNRGKAHPDTNTKLKLFSHSGGFCQNPSCGKLLFPEGHPTNIHIAEMAHIFACADNGPRSNPDLSAEERGAYENIILLCANCHTEIDKAPEKYDDATVTKWKRDHWQKISAALGVVKFSKRKDLRAQIELLLAENRAIHRALGPDLDYQYNPEAAEAEAWQTRVRGSIIPNSNRMLAILHDNRHLLTEDEVNIVGDFKVHVDGLVLRHIDGQNVPNVRFPARMDKIGKSETEQ